MTRAGWVRIAGWLVILLSSATIGLAQNRFADRLTEAKGLYQSAEYDAALSVLERIDAATIGRDDARDRAVFQALCFVALNRRPDAEAAIQPIIERDPFYSPGPDVTPRLRGVVADVRERLRPALVQKFYADGKERFDRADYTGALEQFGLALRLIDEVPAPGPTSVLENIRTLAVGFRDLSKEMLAHAERPKPAPTPPAGSAITTPAPETIPPVAIRQDIPVLSEALASTIRDHSDTPICVLELEIDLNGAVKSVKIVRSVHPLYDSLLLAAAKRWKYRPATRDGVPVPYLKRLIVNVATP